jgi:hypothetical protein
MGSLRSDQHEILVPGLDTRQLGTHVPRRHFLARFEKRELKWLIVVTIAFVAIVGVVAPLVIQALVRLGMQFWTTFLCWDACD